MNKKLLRKLSGITIIIITALLGFQTLKAEVPNPPRDFYGESGGKNLIVFHWNYDDVKVEFDLYAAKGRTEDMSKFKKIDFDPANIINENGQFILYYEEPNQGEHSYYLTARNDKGESKRSKIAFIEPYKEQEMIWFLDYPQISNLKKGEVYKYDFNAETNVEGDQIVYTMIEKESDGGTINSKTGEFEFSANEGGKYRFAIKAELKDKPHVVSVFNFELRVNKCDVGATISGNITDEDNIPITMGEVYLSPAKDGWENKTPPTFSGIQDGKYKFENVDEGEYYLYFSAYGERKDSAGMYISEYYNDAQNPEDAEVLKVECAGDYSYSAQLAKVDFKNYKIKITSEPPKSARIGDKISYQVTYTTDLENPVPMFKMSTNADGAKLDEKTGLLSWSPKKNGIYFFSINVYLKEKKCGPSYQEFTINVRECEVGATISGKVTNTKDEPIKFGMATLYSVTSDYPKVDGISLQTEIKDGVYKFENVDKGKYYLYFDAGFDGRKREEDPAMVYMGQWYDNATNPVDAKIIELNCGDSYTADAKLKENPFNKFKISIVSEPTKTMKLGDTWTYEVKAETDIENPEFVYVIYSPLEGPTIDPATGVITWTPTKNGIYQFGVGVYTKEYGANFAAYQDFTLRVNECDQATTINISVKNQDGELIPNSVVYVLQAMDNPNEKYGFTVIWYGYSQTGQESITGLDKGQYYLYAQAFPDSTYDMPNYYPWWYDAKYDFEKADMLELNCGDTKEITAVLEKIPVPNMYKVSGKVVDKETQDPIKHSSVVFIGTEKKTKMTQYFDCGVKEDGKYVIELPDNFDYIAYAAYYMYKDGGNWQDTYLPQYYDGVADPTEATTISLTADKENVNFQLSKLATYANSLTGTLTGEDEAIIQKGFVVAYLVEVTNPEEKFMLYTGTSCQVNEEGKFLMENLIPGKYVIYGSPDRAKTYAPGYYKENELAVINWEEATSVTVNADGESGSYKVVLPFKDKGLTGNGKIHGAVSKGNKMKITDDLTTTDPINGANIYLIDSNGNIIESMNTDANGSFSMDNLAYGGYLLIADKIGLQNNTQMIFIKEGDDDISRTIELEQKNTGVEDNNLSGNKVYPNPAKTQVTIEYIGTIGNSEITVINSIGEDVKTINTSAITGVNVLNVDVSSFTAGSYFIRINNNGSTEILPIIVNK